MHSNRNHTIDLMKTILVLLMTFSHLTYYTSMQDYYNVRDFNIFVDLTSFSGFLFCFGFVSWNAYFNNPNRSSYEIITRIIKGSLKSLIAYYIAGALETFVLLKYDFSFFLNIFFFKAMPGLGEFLLSFSLLYLFILVFKPIIKKINLFGFIIIILLTLSISFLPCSEIHNPIIASIIGSKIGYTFPIVLYLSHFLIGVIFAKYNFVFNPMVLLFSIICSVSFYYSVYITKNIPNRFPPSTLWIVGSTGIIYIYYIICHFLSSKKFMHKIIYYLTFPGRNTLLILLSGNFIVYSFYDLRKLIGYENLDSFKRETFMYLIAVLTTLLLSISIYFIKCFIQKHLYSNNTYR